MATTEAMSFIEAKCLSRAEVEGLLPYLEETRERAIRDNFELAVCIADCIGVFEYALGDEMFL